MRVSQMESSFLFLPSWFTFFLLLLPVCSCYHPRQYNNNIPPLSYKLLFGSPYQFYFFLLIFFSRPNRNQSTLINPIRYYVLCLPYRSLPDFQAGNTMRQLYPATLGKKPTSKRNSLRIKETFPNVCVLLDGPQIAVAAPSNIRILMRERVDGLIASVSWWPSQRHTARKEKKTFCFVLFLYRIGRSERVRQICLMDAGSLFFSSLFLCRFRQSNNPFPFAEHI